VPFAQNFSIKVSSVERIILKVKCQSSKVKSMPKSKCQFASADKTQNLTARFAGQGFGVYGFFFGCLSLGFDLTFEL